VHATVAASDEQKTTPMQLKRQQAAHRRFLTSLKTYSQIGAFEGRSARTFADLVK
jgi:hypothetical protein